MIKYFQPLNDDEASQLIAAPSVVTVLIAGADDNIDKKEQDWASKLVQFRTFTSDPKLHSYYEKVSELFPGQLDALVSEWKSGESEAELSEKVAALKPILAKLDAEYAEMLTKSWRSLARKVAEASGGILGFRSVDSNEARLIDLPMLN